MGFHSKWPKWKWGYKFLCVISILLVYLKKYKNSSKGGVVTNSRHNSQNARWTTRYHGGSRHHFILSITYIRIWSSYRSIVLEYSSIGWSRYKMSCLSLTSLFHINFGRKNYEERSISTYYTIKEDGLATTEKLKISTLCLWVFSPSSNNYLSSR